MPDKTGSTVDAPADPSPADSGTARPRGRPRSRAFLAALVTCLAWIGTAACGQGEAAGGGNEAQSGQTEEPAATGADGSAGTAAAATMGEALYQERCASCHGPDGRGEGPAAQALEPKPRDHTSTEWQESVTDEDIAEIIRRGGVAAGLSASMPSFADLSQDQVQSLVEYIRSLESA